MYILSAKTVHVFSKKNADEKNTWENREQKKSISMLNKRVEKFILNFIHPVPNNQIYKCFGCHAFSVLRPGDEQRDWAQRIHPAIA